MVQAPADNAFKPDQGVLYRMGMPDSYRECLRPDQFAAIEHFHRLELGFSTLRDQCLDLDPGKLDSEIGARFVQLYELWCWGCPIEPIDVHTPAQDRLRHSTAARLACLCQVMLERVADDRCTEGVAAVQ